MKESVKKFFKGVELYSYYVLKPRLLIEKLRRYGEAGVDRKNVIRKYLEGVVAYIFYVLHPENLISVISLCREVDEYIKKTEEKREKEFQEQRKEFSAWMRAATE